LPAVTKLGIGEAVIEITGLRNPCHQINQITDGLMKKLVFKDETGNLVRLCGVMGVILPDKPYIALQTV